MTRTRNARIAGLMFLFYIPVAVLLAVLLPVQLIGILKGVATDYIWAPAAVFEVVLAFWLIIRGVGPPRPRAA